MKKNTMDTEFKITLVIRMLEEVSVNFNKKKKKKDMESIKKNQSELRIH